MTRRDAFKVTAMTAASYSRVLGANDRVNLGLIGAGDRGRYVMTLFQKTNQVDVKAVCDVYAERVDKALTAAPGAASFVDHRKLLETKDLDAVLIGTPDHWHMGTAIDALNAGKDVYVEKPLTRLREEGPKIVKAARVNERVCQVGMQQRSGTVYLEALERYVKSGALGRVTHARCVWNNGFPKPGRMMEAVKYKEQPSNLDWARFLGPVKWREWAPAQFFNFRAFLDFGGGRLTDFGVHWIDVVHMFLGQDAPLSVSSAGGIYFENLEQRTAPDSVAALFDYDGFTVQFESLIIANGPDYGVEFFGEKGRLFVNRNRYEFRSVEKGAEPVIKKFQGDITQEHVQNFLDCCRSRKRPNGDVYHGHRSAQACLLAVQAYQEKRRINFDPVREEIA